VTANTFCYVRIPSSKKQLSLQLHHVGLTWSNSIKFLPHDIMGKPVLAVCWYLSVRPYLSHSFILSKRRKISFIFLGVMASPF